MNCDVAFIWMHDYLDGELSAGEAQRMRAHLLECERCNERFEQLQRTEALAFGLMNHCSVKCTVDANLHQQIMQKIQIRRARAAALLRSIRRHPIVSVASVVAVIMISGYVVMWHQDKQFTVSGQDLAHVIITGNTVIVPEGTRIAGGLLVEHGQANVLGEVEGDVIVVDGQLVKGTEAHVSGKTEQIDRMVDWFWYRFKNTLKED